MHSALVGDVDDNSEANGWKLISRRQGKTIDGRPTIIINNLHVCMGVVCSSPTRLIIIASEERLSTAVMDDGMYNDDWKLNNTHTEWSLAIIRLC